MRKSINLKGNKGFRLLLIYERMNKGEVLNKDSLSKEFNVSLKTIQRDFNELRIYLREIYPFEIETIIKYDRKLNGYYLKRSEIDWLTKEEVLIISLILLGSHSLAKNEITSLINKLKKHITYYNKKHIENIISDDFDKYISFISNGKMLQSIWKLTEYITNREIISFKYKLFENNIYNIVKPVSILFRNYHFYLIAYTIVEDKEELQIFRIDYIEEVRLIGEKFYIPYSNKFSNSEYRRKLLKNIK
ncbi:helix-turn-helix transcriptional regulator [Miniphocaeibacter halophilus]|uniref:WYL domain-containing protein n=1 Tax=Miniphocaeibacter halophilus TaxID=2931922 RepID=A0AC61N1R1_9FIRM|nr:WYL domain-containing protein [Miniphocaeibacter halophilus]QQK09016.1 WYL domain-containing protein [Miniphocaeibacter halophilus]